MYKLHIKAKAEKINFMWKNKTEKSCSKVIEYKSLAVENRRISSEKIF
jgi:hypothetical protein